LDFNPMKLSYYSNQKQEKPKELPNKKSFNGQVSRLEERMEEENQGGKTMAQFEFCLQDDLTKKDLDIRALQDGIVKVRKLTDLPRHARAAP